MWKYIVMGAGLMTGALAVLAVVLLMAIAFGVIFYNIGECKKDDTK